MPKVNRQTIELDQYPDLVVIYLGMQIYSLRGLRTFAKLGRGVRGVRLDPPDGLLLHEDFFFQQWPPHGAFRQYWRDFDALEAWTRELPHQQWWRDFLQDSQGTGFWHEAHSVRGGIDAVYDDMRKLPGLAAFAPVVPAKGPLFSSRNRLSGEASRVAPVYAEEALP